MIHSIATPTFTVPYHMNWVTSPQHVSNADQSLALYWCSLYLGRLGPWFLIMFRTPTGYFESDST